MIGEDSYNKAAALDFVEFARVAFCTEEAIKAWDCGEMCDQNPVDRSSVRLIGPGSHSGVMAYAVPRTALGRQDDTGHSCVLAFRGSVNTKNWFADADAELVPWPGGQYSSWCQGCKVHRGFAGAYSELQEEAVSVLNSLQCSSVAVTGHSLGAAIATVAALDLRRQHHFIIDALWTFGSPRVGNREFVYHWLSAAAKQSTARNATWRVVHYRDPIPQLAMNGEYWHVPQEVWYTERYSDKYEVCGWTHDALENFSCGMWRVTPSELAEGTLSGDHVHYLGKSFALSDMNSRCHGLTERKAVAWCCPGVPTIRPSLGCEHLVHGPECKAGCLVLPESSPRRRLFCSWRPNGVLLRPMQGQIPVVAATSRQRGSNTSYS
eukprot:TRINITY_DN9001_c0_g1_i1.p1 TRINITY_DN9001_c0_g1~~TRINITY_DN9001_c0_g1_i1.p1  ORF type:complete len:378 (-),score=41.20 TRINITY_DN9001_c0_g1_i1:73-1206(-)